MLLTDGTIMRTIHTGILPNLSQISTSSKAAQICPTNNNISLFSLGKLCDDYCETKINKKLAQCMKKTKRCSQNHVVHMQT